MCVGVWFVCEFELCDFVGCELCDCMGVYVCKLYDCICGCMCVIDEL